MPTGPPLLPLLLRRPPRLTARAPPHPRVATARRQLATKAATQGEVSGPGAEALRPRLLLQLRRPDADGGGGRIEIQ